MPLIQLDAIDLCSVCCAYLSGVGAIDGVWISIVPLSLSSEARREQVAGKVSNTQRDREEVGRSEVPRGIEERRNAANRA